jgi:hypothetical protein
MSVISLLVCNPDQLPSIERLREEAARGGDPIEFSSVADLRSHTGYLPLRAFGRDTGFEFCFEAIPQGSLPQEILRFGSHQIVARTGSDFEEGRAALVFLRVVARLTHGAYVYPDDDLIVPPNEVQTYLDAQIAEFGKYIK